MNNLNLSHRTQLLATALAASLATAGLLHAYNVHTKRVRRKELNEEIKRSIIAHDPELEKVQQIPINGLEHPRLDKGITYDEELIKEQLARNYAFFGEESMAKIRQASVVIVGCGGVGSWAAVMLARS